MSVTSQARSRAQLRAVAVAFLVGVLGFVVGLPVIFVYGLLLQLAGIELTPVVIVVVGLLALQGTAFPLVAYAYMRWRDLPFSFVQARLPSVRDWLVGAAGWIGAFLLAFAGTALIQFLDAPTAQRSDQELLTNPEVLLWLIPLSFLLIGPGEELLFRGVIQRTLRETFSAPAAIVLASLAFAPAHVVSFTGSLTGIVVSISLLFFPSLVFGAIYEYTDNLVVPALAHGAYDATIAVILYVGTQIQPGSGGEALLWPLALL